MNEEVKLGEWVDFLSGIGTPAHSSCPVCKTENEFGYSDYGSSLEVILTTQKELSLGQTISFSCGVCGYISRHDTAKFKEWLDNG